MKNYSKQKKSLLAVQAALLAMFMAPVVKAEADPAVAELTEPSKEIAIGVIGVSKKSY